MEHSDCPSNVLTWKKNENVKENEMLFVFSNGMRSFRIRNKPD